MKLILRDTLTINSSKVFDDGIWVENFEDGIPSEGIVYYNSSGGGMTFTVANDDPLLEIVTLRWVAG